MASPQIQDGKEGFQLWRIEGNFPNKQSQVGNKGWTSSLGVGGEPNNFTVLRSMKPKHYKRDIGHQELDGYVGTTCAT
jgi:hypothetical protein